MTINDFKIKLNEWGHNRVPFLFVVDFEMQKPLVWKLEEIDTAEILFSVSGKSNAKTKKNNLVNSVSFSPISLECYKKKFHRVMAGLEYGDSFLTNLTVKTEIQFEASLEELFHSAKAKYKLWIRDKFLVFSPEPFVHISNGKIFSYPMKGTIDATVPNAENKILHDQKELAEHVTIVDLIRNDLSQVAQNVTVKKFRYVEEVVTTNKKLLQVSSEIEGDLDHDYLGRLGNIVVSLLPAGSISGAPKKRTVEIIREAEGEKRGYYTGVFGIFDGQNLDSAVMIRFIEKDGEKYFYRSGGGITTQSELNAEYQEALDKIYVPID